MRTAPACLKAWCSNEDLSMTKALQEKQTKDFKNWCEKEEN